MREFPDCLACSIPGEKLYEGLTDRLLSVPGTFNLKKCPSCGMLWLDPMADAAEIPGFYKDYFIPEARLDEGANKQQRRPLAALRDFVRQNIIFGYYGYKALAKRPVYARLGAVLGKVPVLRSRASYTIFGYLPFKHLDPQALVVDVGCGRGIYLDNLKDLGWRVQGIEVDHKAAEMARGKGIDVFEGTLEQARLPDASVDLVTMMHVVEHVLDPVSLIKECLRVLKKGGMFVMRTPNANSLGHAIFTRNCYHLDPPRHLFLYSPRSMRLLLERCGVVGGSIKTASLSAHSIYDNSMMIARNGKTTWVGVRPQPGRGFFTALETVLIGLGFGCGEELEVVVIKR